MIHPFLQISMYYDMEVNNRKYNEMVELYL